VNKRKPLCIIHPKNENIQNNQNISIEFLQKQNENNKITESNFINEALNTNNKQTETHIQK